MCLKQIPSLCGPILVVKTYHIIQGKDLLCHCHLESLRCIERTLCILKVRSFGIVFPNPVHFKCTLIWNNLPYFVKSSASVFEFEKNLKTLGSINCSCLNCKIAKISFVRCRILLPLVFISHGYHCRPAINMFMNT